MFAGCSMIKQINFINFDTSYTNNMKYMFANCKKLERINLYSFNTKNVIKLSNMFYNCSNIISLDLSSFDTKNVVNPLTSLNDVCSRKREGIPYLWGVLMHANSKGY